MENKVVMSDRTKQRMLFHGHYKSVANHTPFMQLKSANITMKPKISTMIHTMANQPVSRKDLKQMGSPQHAAVKAQSKTKKELDSMINQISNRLYNNAQSPVPSDFALFKAAN